MPTPAPSPASAPAPAPGCSACQPEARSCRALRQPAGVASCIAVCLLSCASRAHVTSISWSAAIRPQPISSATSTAACTSSARSQARRLPGGGGGAFAVRPHRCGHSSSATAPSSSASAHSRRTASVSRIEVGLPCMQPISTISRPVLQSVKRSTGGASANARGSTLNMLVERGETAYHTPVPRAYRS
eukprot:scaffold62962_cov73-Phaeocystis_antarctica.AAC.3